MRDEAYFTSQHCCGKQQNGRISRMLFPEMYKIMVNKVIFLGFRGGDYPSLYFTGKDFLTFCKIVVLL